MKILSFAAYAPGWYLHTRYWIGTTFFAPWTTNPAEACRMSAPWTGLAEILAEYPLAQLVDP